MRQITVEIPNEQTFRRLLTVLQQMNLRVVTKSPAKGSIPDSPDSAPLSIKEQLLAKPRLETFDSDAIKNAQNWQGRHDKSGMIKLINAMDVQEPIELLIAQLSR